MKINSICVFMGSRYGVRPEYKAAAHALGAELARQKIRLVFGAYKDGLMKEVADAALSAGGSVVGVIPRNTFEAGMTYDNLDALYEVESMDQRKLLMTELADAFILLPGGLGSFEEFFQVWSWAALGLHAKPIGILDVAEYYAPLMALMNTAVTEGFIRQTHYPAAYDTDPAALLHKLQNAESSTLLHTLHDHDAESSTVVAR